MRVDSPERPAAQGGRTCETRHALVTGHPQPKQQSPTRARLHGMCLTFSWPLGPVNSLFTFSWPLGPVNSCVISPASRGCDGDGR